MIFDDISVSLVVSVAALLFSVLSPFFSSVLNGHYRIKEKKLDNAFKLQQQQQEFYLLHRADVIERFITSAGAAIKLSTNDALNQLGASMGEIYLYVDKDLWPLIDGICDSMQRCDNANAYLNFIEFCKSLSAENIRPKDQQKP